MDYLKLRNKLETSKINITDLFKKLNMSRSSFYYMLEHRTMKVDTLEQICKTIKIPVVEFLSKESVMGVNEPAMPYGEKETIEDLKQQCIEYRATIKTLNELLNEKKQQRKK